MDHMNRLSHHKLSGHLISKQMFGSSTIVFYLISDFNFDLAAAPARISRAIDTVNPGNAVFA
jgi:hypothetical protein